MAYTYFTVARSTDERGIRVKDLSYKVERYFELSNAVPVGSRVFPPSTVLSIDPRSGDMLTDFIDNPDAVLYVSANAREVLFAKGVGDTAAEYLPFILHDKQGRVVKEQYFIVNLLRSIPCFDRKRSNFETYPHKPDKISLIWSIQLLEEQIPEDAKLFRMAEATDFIIIRSDLWEAIQKAGLTGLEVKALGEDVT